MSGYEVAPGVVLERHETDYRVYASADDCKHPQPEAGLDAFDEWYDDHPHGEGMGGDTVEICLLTITGTYCRECSEDQGDWTPHIIYCAECTYPCPDCQCEPMEETK